MGCAHAHSYNLYCAQELLQGSSLKKKSVSGDSFIRGKSVKEELLVKQIGALISGHYYSEQTTAMFGKIMG